MTCQHGNAACRLCALDEAHKEVTALRARNAKLEAALSRKAEQPKLTLALPDYEKRRIVIASDEVIDGERLVCVAIKEAEQPAEASAQAEELPPLPDGDEYSATRMLANGELAPRFTAATMRDYARAAIAADRASRAAEAQGEGLTELAALKVRVELVHRLCCGTAPKQSVGELIAVTLKMPEWNAIAAHLRAAGQGRSHQQSAESGEQPSLIATGAGQGGDEEVNRIADVIEELMGQSKIDWFGSNPNYEGGDDDSFASEEHERAYLCRLIRNVIATKSEKGGDGERLDWLDSQGVAYGFEDLHEGNRWEINGPFPNLRAAIDAAKAKAEEQQG